MLQLILGGSGSGKTALLYQRIRTLAQSGHKSILLVPEQFTSSTEGRIYRELGDERSALVESFSFTSLAERILSADIRTDPAGNIKADKEKSTEKITL